MKKEKKEKLRPDFIQIPYQLIEDRTLSPTDRLVYGAIYYFSKMRGERCFASNITIADLIASTPKTISRSLQKLEDRRYIARGFSDPDTKVNRVEIIPFVAMKHSNIRKVNTPNGGVSGQKVNTPNGVPTTPNGVPKYPKQGTTKSTKKPVKVDKKGKETALDKGKDDLSTPNGEYPVRRTDREYIENTIKNSNRELQSSPPGNDYEGVLEPGEFTSLVDSNQRYKTVEEVPGGEVNEAIALFITIFPSQFGTERPFVMKTNRTAVTRMLMTITLAELQEIITKYVLQKGDKWRPEAGSIIIFCNKLDQIEAYIKKSGGLWAHRSISSPKQKADSDAQIRRIIEESEGKTRLAKKEWLKDHPEE